MKGVGGRYEVYIEGSGVVNCSAKGILRYRKVRPLIGDNVTVEMSEGETEGNLVNVLPRSNALIRPAVANIDQAMIVFAMSEPEPHLNLLDRFLILMRMERVPVIICFNKTDKGTKEQEETLRRIYGGSGAELFFTKATTAEGLAAVYAKLCGKTTVLAGPSGVGKSTILNALQPEARMETGCISEKIKRGKHTTRHSQLIYVAENTYLCDTPGFSSLYLTELTAEELAGYYEEFEPFVGKCRFPDCVHRNEPECAVKAAVVCETIPKERYESYRLLFDELDEKKRRN